MRDFLDDVKTVLLRIVIGLAIFVGWISLGDYLLMSVLGLDEWGFWGECIECVVILGGLIIPIVVFVLIKGFKSRCIKCKKLFAMKETETRLVGKKPEYFTQMNNTYSAYDGRVTHRSEQRILGTRKYYQTLYVCKYCSEKMVTSYSECTDEVWQDTRRDAK